MAEGTGPAAGADKERRVAVIVVHGVGDSQPGSTVNYVVDSLSELGSSARSADAGGGQALPLLADPVRGRVTENHVFHLPEPDSEVAARRRDDTRSAGRRRTDQFTVHGRSMPLPARHAGERSAGQADFYELHWADLARTGTGWVDRKSTRLNSSHRT